ncbi:MAG: glycosyltransferase family 2 protein [Coxiellaceae bacterium]|nr:glycosyltransferase family 2 protein [Coxiellaceae bacterium]
MKHITIVTGCYNEEENVQALYEQVKYQLSKLPHYTYDHIFIDNASKDRTVEILKEVAAIDKNVKVIVNTRNFGHIRSPFHALLQAKGDAVISIVADLQDPPEMIPELLKKWEDGFKVVVGVKPSAAENPIKAVVRRFCYRVFSKLTYVKQIKNFTGFGLYDQKFIQALRQLDDPYPYFRGLVADIGYEVAEIPYHQPKREHGKTKNNFFTLYDMAILGLTSYSKAPIRLAAFLGFILSGFSFFLAIIFLALKLIFWNHFAFGMAPILIGIFFFSSVQLFFIGMLGEYIAAIHTQVQKRPLVFELERINFDQ